jgi:hypothetical protein
MTATSKALTAFSFVTPPATGVISGLEVAVTVPVDTDVTELTATFVSTGNSVTVEDVVQVSATTVNDFTEAVTYVVIATDLSESEYVITVVVSKVTPIEIAKLRRKVNEPTTTTYSDALLTTYIEQYPHIDQFGEEPLDEWGLENIDWTPTFDLNAAAGDIWEEKAGALASKFNYSADGGSFDQSSQYEQYMKQCRYFRARRMPRTAMLLKSPKETGSEESWIGNLPESRE